MFDRKTQKRRLVLLWWLGHPHTLIQQHTGLPLAFVVKTCDFLTIMRLNGSI